MDAEIVRRAAIVLAAMHPQTRTGLLTGLDAAMRDQLSHAITEVKRRGWNHRAMALRVLEAPVPVEGTAQDTACDDVMVLIDYLEPAAFACVLHAEGTRSDDFRLAVIPVARQLEVREALAARKPMPPQLREATRAAAQAMLCELRDGGGEHAPR